MKNILLDILGFVSAGIILLLSGTLVAFVMFVFFLQEKLYNQVQQPAEEDNN